MDQARASQSAPREVRYASDGWDVEPSLAHRWYPATLLSRMMDHDLAPDSGNETPPGDDREDTARTCTFRQGEAEDALAFALAAARLGSWDVDLVTGVLNASLLCREIFGLRAEEPYSYEHMLSRIHHDDRPRRDAAFAEAIRKRSDLELEYRVHRMDGTIAWIQLRGRAEYGTDGLALRIAGVSLDVTDRKLLESKQCLLLDELNHRVKNMLTTVMSISMQTRQSAISIEDYGLSLDARLTALARAQDLLIDTAWDGADLEDVVAQALAPYAVQAHRGPRVSYAGPPIHLNANAAVTMTMAFHELATNAVKYGALSLDEGKVDVRWSVHGPMQNVAQIHILWSEHDGPPAEVPARRGYGFRLLERGISRELGGGVTLSFEPSGLRCHMRFPVSSKMGPVV